MEPYISKTQGPCLILAGAGTGKTYSIVEKIKYLIKNKIYRPEKIVCLTFSNEATNSLRTKILRKLDDGEEPIIRTFHSFCSDLIKENGDLIDTPKDFKILLPDDAKILLHKYFKIKPFECNSYVSAISHAKDLGIKIEELEKFIDYESLDIDTLQKNAQELKFKLHTLYIKDKTDKKKEIEEEIDKLENRINLGKLIKSWKGYEKIKQKGKLLDYSDLNKKALEILEKNPEISKKYDYIIVDEFQDTNKLQCDFLEKICQNKNITMVGDPNQSIYRFRGAYKDNFSNIKKAFGIKESDIFNLAKSYRSTNKILEIAHQLVSHNYQNQEECFKVLSAFNREGDKIKVFELKNSKEEIRKIVEIIDDEINNNVPLEEICVIFRTHQQSNLLKKYLEYKNIPYNSATKKSLLKINLIKKIRDYLTILDKIIENNKGGEHNLWNLIHESDFDTEDELSISNFIKSNKESECISIKFLEEGNKIKLSEKGRIQIKKIIKTLENLIELKDKEITEIITKLYEELGLQESAENNKEKLIILEKFFNLAQEYSDFDSKSLRSFVRHLEVIDTLQINIDAPSLEDGGIRIMTNHATKGLEYKTVIMSNMAQKKFPIERITHTLIPLELYPEIKPLIFGLDISEIKEKIKSNEIENQMFEERRLCYVGFTRAKSKLFLTYSEKYGERKYHPSQFLNEINYKKNQNIDFIKDSEEKYEEPQLEIAPVIPQQKETIFSPSALQTFDQCQKRYEFKYVFNMPEPTPLSWEAIKLGSFIHKVLELGVKNKLNSEKDFVDLAKDLQMDEKWISIQIEEAIPMIRVFYERNKNKIRNKSLVEEKLNIRIGNLKFFGIADRIDINENDEVEIIDYKTGKYPIPPKYRNWQLGFYAIASEKYGKPKKLTLEMLQKEKPIEFEIDKDGNANEIHSKRTSFNLNEVKSELLETANKIIECKKSGFSPCPVEKNCDFCEEWVY